MTRTLTILVARSLLVLLAVSLAVFLLLRFAGDPVLAVLGPRHTRAQYEETRHSLGLDQPLRVQYARFLAGAVQGDLGRSYHHNAPAAGLILERLPATVELAVAAMLLAGAFAFPLGILAAVRPSGPLARILLTGSLLGISAPTFFIGLMLIFIFSVVPHVWHVAWLPELPAGGRIAGGMEVPRQTGFLLIDTLLAGRGDSFLSALRHLLMPAMTLGFYYLAVLMRLIRGAMIDELAKDYVRVARAKGLSDAAVTVRHALRNALIPVVTVMGLQLGGLIAFSVVTETIFQWPGMGKLLIDSIGVNDQPVIMAYLLLVAVIFVTINFTVDVLYTVIDPRIRLRS